MNIPDVVCTCEQGRSHCLVAHDGGVDAAESADASHDANDAALIVDATDASD